VVLDHFGRERRVERTVVLPLVVLFLREVGDVRGPEQFAARLLELLVQAGPGGARARVAEDERVVEPDQAAAGAGPASAG
jgi:hypothetical protein